MSSWNDDSPLPQPRVVGGRYLYLDLDGVLHPERVYSSWKRGAFLDAQDVADGHALFEHAPLLEELLSPYPDVAIVLSTSWVRVYSFSRVRRRLSPGLAARTVGATFHSAMDRQDFGRLDRGEQVVRDVARRRPTAWLAIDDDFFGWPTWAADHVVHTDLTDGIAHPEITPLLTRRLGEQFSDRTRS